MAPIWLVGGALKCNQFVVILQACELESVLQERGSIALEVVQSRQQANSIDPRAQLQPPIIISGGAQKAN